MSSAALTSSPTGEFLYEYDGLKLVILAAFFIPLQVGFVLLRTWSRSLTEAKMGLDDILIWPSMFLCLAIDTIAFAMVKSAGVGRHMSALGVLGESHKIILWAKLLLAIQWIYITAVTLPKICMLILYLQIFTNKSLRMACYVLIAVILGNFLAGGLTSSLSCIPLAKFWNKSLAGHCIDTNAFFRWISFPNIVTDVGILVLPLPLVWGLHATKNHKLGLLLTFLTGSTGLIISIIRFATFFQNDALEDGTMASVDLMTWTIIEPGMYLIAACLVTMRPLLRHIFQRHGSRTYATQKSRSRRYKISSSDNRDMPLASMEANIGSRRVPNASEVDEHGVHYKNHAACMAGPRDKFEIREHQIVVKHDFEVSMASRQLT